MEFAPPERRRAELGQVLQFISTPCLVILNDSGRCGNYSFTGNPTSFTYYVTCLCFECVSLLVQGKPGEFYHCFVFSECFSIMMGKPNQQQNKNGGICLESCVSKLCH